MKIVQYPHPALRHPARPLAAIDKQVHLDAGHMLELMYEHRGLGLAANQVFLPYRIIVLNPTGDPQQRDKEEVLLNPVILERKGTHRRRGRLSEFSRTVPEDPPGQDGHGAGV